MKIPISCSECTKELNTDKPTDLHEIILLVSDAGYYEFTCPKGHKTVTVLNMPRYDLLFTLGMNSFIDSYYREALVNFSASLERFYEFVLRILARSNQIDPEFFKESWRILSNQSERQFGAFIFCWLLQEKKLYTEMSRTKIDKMTKLRNEVVHKGKIATEDECKKYGQYVVDIIQPIKSILWKKYRKFCEEEEFFSTREIRNEKNIKDLPGTILHIRSALDDCINKGFDQALKELIFWRRQQRTDLKHGTVISRKTQCVK